MEKAQKKMGRPPIENAKTERLVVRVTPKEKKFFQDLAKEKGLTVSELILSKFKIK